MDSSRYFVHNLNQVVAMAPLLNQKLFLLTLLCLCLWTWSATQTATPEGFSLQQVVDVLRPLSPTVGDICPTCVISQIPATITINWPLRNHNPIDSFHKLTPQWAPLTVGAWRITGTLYLTMTASNASVKQVSLYSIITAWLARGHAYAFAVRLVFRGP